MLDVSTQKLPATEGHVSEQKLPRVEGEGVKDAVEPSEYPKHVPHPIHGSVIAKDAGHEAVIQAQIASLPPKPEPTPEELEILFMEKVVGRSFTGAEKAFLKEVSDAIDKHDGPDDPEDDIIIPQNPALAAPVEPLDPEAPAVEPEPPAAVEPEPPAAVEPEPPAAVEPAAPSEEAAVAAQE